MRGVSEYEFEPHEIGASVTCQICGKQFIAAIRNYNHDSSKTSSKLPFGCVFVCFFFSDFPS